VVSSPTATTTTTLQTLHGGRSTADAQDLPVLGSRAFRHISTLLNRVLGDVIDTSTDQHNQHVPPSLLSYFPETLRGGKGPSVLWHGRRPSLPCARFSMPSGIPLPVSRAQDISLSCFLYPDVSVVVYERRDSVQTPAGMVFASRWLSLYAIEAAVSARQDRSRSPASELGGSELHVCLGGAIAVV